MKLVGVASVKNEGDVIEAFLRHNLHYLDAMLVMDDNSSDQTLPIISQLIAEGLPIQLRPCFSPDAYRQSEITTQLVQDAAENLQADWVFVLDSDEFIGGQKNGLRMPSPLDADPVKLPWKTYCAQETDEASEPNPVRRIAHRLKNEPVDNKVAIPGPLAKNKSVTVTTGNHFLELQGRRISGKALPDLYLAHFPLRSFAQYCVKIATKRLRYLSESTGAFNQGRQYTMLYEEICNAPAEAEKNWWRRLPPPYSDFSEKDLVRDPFPYVGGPLRYTAPPSLPLLFLASLLPLCESMARRLASHSATPLAGPQQAVLRVLDRNGQTLAAESVALEPGKTCRISLLLSVPLDGGGRLAIESPPCFFSIKSIDLIAENPSAVLSYSGRQVREILMPDEGAVSPDFLEGLYFLKIAKAAVLPFSGKLPGISVRSIRLSLNMESDFFSLNDLSIITPIVLSHASLEKRYRAGRYSLLGRFGHAVYRLRRKFRLKWERRREGFRSPASRA